MNDVDASAIGLPACESALEILVGIRDAAVVFFFEFIDRGLRIGIAATARTVQ